MNEDIYLADWLTKAQLFEYVRSYHLPINESLFNELERNHFMPPHSDERGRGQGRGKDYFWPRQHAVLLRSLCLIHTWSGVHRVSICSNLIVWLWITQKASYGITVKQVRLVMRRWALIEQQLSKKQAAESARQLVALVDNGKKTREPIKKLTETLLKAPPKPLLAREPSDQEKKIVKEFIYDIEDGFSLALINPIKAARTILDASLTPEAVGKMLWNYEQILLALQHPNVFHDSAWFWARKVCLPEMKLDATIPFLPLDATCMNVAVTLLAYILRSQTPPEW